MGDPDLAKKEMFPTRQQEKAKYVIIPELRSPGSAL